MDPQVVRHALASREFSRGEVLTRVVGRAREMGANKSRTAERKCMMAIGQVDVPKRMIDDTSEGRMKLFDRDCFQKPEMGAQEVFYTHSLR